MDVYLLVIGASVLGRQIGIIQLGEYTRWLDEVSVFYLTCKDNDVGTEVVRKGNFRDI